MEQMSPGNYYGDHYTRYFVQNPLLVSGQKPNSQPPVNPIAETGPIEIHLLNVREDGSYITPRTMQHTSSVIHKKLEYKEFDYHSLRHTHATMLTEQGAPLVYIQRRLGHSKLDVTANIYTNHLTNALLKQGNEIINDMF